MTSKWCNNKLPVIGHYVKPFRHTLCHDVPKDRGFFTESVHLMFCPPPFSYFQAFLALLSFPGSPAFLWHAQSIIASVYLLDYERTQAGFGLGPTGPSTLSSLSDLDNCPPALHFESQNPLLSGINGCILRKELGLGTEKS